MSSNLRRPDHGGDPAQGPVPEMANPTPSPRAAENFPDEPASADVGREQDQPDLDAFAERLGLRGDETPDASNDEQVASEPSGVSAVGDRAKRVGSSVASTVASGLANLADRVGRLARRLEPDDHS